MKKLQNLYKWLVEEEDFSRVDLSNTCSKEFGKVTCSSYNFQNPSSDHSGLEILGAVVQQSNFGPMR